MPDAICHPERSEESIFKFYNTLWMRLSQKTARMVKEYPGAPSTSSAMAPKVPVGCI